MKKRIAGMYGLMAAALMLFVSVVLVPEAAAVAMQYAPPDLVAWLNPSDLVVLAPLTSFTHVKRMDRQLSNLGGFVKMLILSEDDFDTTSGDWPKRADITATGECAVVPTPKAGKTFARILFDLNSAKGDSKRVGDLSYQAYNHGFECQIAGYTKEQAKAIDATFNTGAVVIGFRANGDRVVFGSALCPLIVTDDSEFGGKAEDATRTMLKFSASRALDFKPVLLATAVTLAETA